MTVDFFDARLLAKYNTSGPRYTSYPTALEFDTCFNESDLKRSMVGSSNSALSLYVHIPFCHSLCYYCGCNKVVTRHKHKADDYLDHLLLEIAHRGEQCGDKPVTQLHLGGGTPSFLTEKQMRRLMASLHSAFDIQQQAEIGIEIDPREITLPYIDTLAELGFNRLSIGVQDIDAKVQKTINRVQSTAFIETLVARARSAGFVSVNLDLIYGLPHQTTQTFARTLDKVQQIDPDRISLFSYAHLPQRFAAQRKLKDKWLPDASEKLALMKQAITYLNRHGYTLIGMDHFAKPDDELSLAQRQGQLHRNFQGYTTQEDADLLGLGASSISAIGSSYSQNHKSLKDYYRAVSEKGHAIERGIELNQDDILRRDVIQSLMCNLQVNKRHIEALYDIKFDWYFVTSLQSLQIFIDDKLVFNRPDELVVSPKARLLVRNICMAFDVYSMDKIAQQRFSRVI